MIREEFIEVLELAANGLTRTIELTPEDAADAIALLEPGKPSFEGWADVELMGHRQRIAYVRDVELAHRGFLELTWQQGDLEFREIYSPSAVFCLTPIDEEDARRRLSNDRHMAAVADFPDDDRPF